MSVLLLSTLSFTTSACSSASRAEPNADGDDDAGAEPEADTSVLDTAVPEGPISSQGYPCNVARVLARVCRRCHTGAAPTKAPFSLDRYDDSQAPYGAKPVYEAMKDELLARRMPLAPVKITEPDRATLLDWVDAGAPAGEADASCGPP